MSSSDPEQRLTAAGAPELLPPLPVQESDASVTLVALVTVFILALAVVAPPVYAGPQKADHGSDREPIPHGKVEIIRPDGKRTVVDQDSQDAIINWKQFNVGINEQVDFDQPGVNARALNRVLQDNPSEIRGNLTADGQIYLVNPAGIMFGPSSTVNAAKLYAAAGKMSNEDFLAGKDLFTDLDGTVENFGTLEGTGVHLLGKRVANFGTIDVDDGVITMSSGDDVLLGTRTGHVFAKIKDAGQPTGEDGAAVKNEGEVNAGDGSVKMSAGDMFATSIFNNGGTVKADDIELDGGDGTTLASGTIDASTDKPGAQGGSIDILGDNVGLFNGSDLMADGPAGGGTINVGGSKKGKGPLPNAENTFVGSTVTISSDASVNGAGGQVIVWSDGVTNFRGKVSAKGGSNQGDGGFVELSGKETLLYRGEVITTAPHGEMGTLLLDPKNITIDSAQSGTISNPEISVFRDSTVHSTGGGDGDEANNVKESLSDDGSVSTFSGMTETKWSNELSGADVLAIPELETGDLESELSDGAKSELEDFVNNGGGLLMFGDSAGDDIKLLNNRFGFDLSGAFSSGSYSLDSGEASGTSFDGGPSSIPQNNATNLLDGKTLPSGALKLYQSSGSNAVFAVDQNSGRISRLAWDWYNSDPPNSGGQDGGWQAVLDNSVDHVVSTGNADTVDPNNLFGESSTSYVTFDPADIESQLDGTNLILQANNDITVDEEVDATVNSGTGDLTLEAGRSITFNDNVLLKGDLSATANDAAAQASNRESGDASITMANGTKLDTSATNGSTTLKYGNGPNGDDNTGAMSLETLNSGTGAIALETKANEGGSTSYEDITLNNSLTGGSTSITGSQVAVNGSMDVDGALTLASASTSASGGDVDLNASVSQTASGTVTVRPVSTATGTPIQVGNTGVDSELNISSTSLGNLSDGFSKIIFGNSSQSGTITVASKISWMDSVHFNAGAGDIQVDAKVDTSADRGANITYTGDGSTTTWSSNQQTDGGDILVNDRLLIDGDILADTEQGGDQSAGDITVEGSTTGSNNRADDAIDAKTDANDTLTLDADGETDKEGDIDIRGDVGDNTSLGRLEIEHADAVDLSDVTTSTAGDKNGNIEIGSVDQTRSAVTLHGSTLDTSGAGSDENSGKVFLDLLSSKDVVLSGDVRINTDDLGYDGGSNSTADGNVEISGNQIKGQSKTYGLAIDAGGNVIDQNDSTTGVDLPVLTGVAHFVAISEGSVSVENSSNDVGTLAGISNGTFDYVDTDAVTVGSAQSVTGIASNGGAISITSANGGSGDLTIDGKVSAGSASISLTVSGSDNTLIQNSGNKITTTDASIELVADDMELNGAAGEINTGTGSGGGDVFVRPNTATAEVLLGASSATDDPNSGGSLALSEDEVNVLDTNGSDFVVFGEDASANQISGQITIDSAVDATSSGAGNLHLVTTSSNTSDAGKAITDTTEESGGNTLTATDLALEADGEIDLNTSAVNLAADGTFDGTTDSQIFLENKGNVTIKVVEGVGGIDAEKRIDVITSSGGNLTLSDSVETGSSTGASVFLNAAGAIKGDFGDTSDDLIAGAAGLQAVGGIGASNALETNLGISGGTNGKLNARNTESGALRIDNAGDLILTDTVLGTTHAIENAAGSAEITVGSNETISGSVDVADNYFNTATADLTVEADITADDNVGLRADADATDDSGDDLFHKSGQITADDDGDGTGGVLLAAHDVNLNASGSSPDVRADGTFGSLTPPAKNFGIAVFAQDNLNVNNELAATGTGSGQNVILQADAELTEISSGSNTSWPDPLDDSAGMGTGSDDEGTLTFNAAGSATSAAIDAAGAVSLNAAEAITVDASGMDIEASGTLSRGNLHAASGVAVLSSGGVDFDPATGTVDIDTTGTAGGVLMNGNYDFSELTTADLGVTDTAHGDVTGGSVRIDGTITTSGSAATMAGGDVTLMTDAPGSDVWVSGLIDASGANDASGWDGGTVTAEAERGDVRVDDVLTSGGDATGTDRNGGDAGAINLQPDDGTTITAGGYEAPDGLVTLTGDLHADGGAPTGAGTTGSGGTIELASVPRGVNGVGVASIVGSDMDGRQEITTRGAAGTGRIEIGQDEKYTSIGTTGTREDGDLLLAATGRVEMGDVVVDGRLDVRGEGSGDVLFHTRDAGDLLRSDGSVVTDQGMDVVARGEIRFYGVDQLTPDVSGAGEGDPQFASLTPRDISPRILNSYVIRSLETFPGLTRGTTVLDTRSTGPLFGLGNKLSRQRLQGVPSNIRPQGLPKEGVSMRVPDLVEHDTVPGQVDGDAFDDPVSEHFNNRNWSFRFTNSSSFFRDAVRAREQAADNEGESTP